MTTHTITIDQLIHLLEQKDDLLIGKSSTKQSYANAISFIQGKFTIDQGRTEIQPNTISKIGLLSLWTNTAYPPPFFFR